MHAYTYRTSIVTCEGVVESGLLKDKFQGGVLGPFEAVETGKEVLGCLSRCRSKNPLQVDLPQQTWSCGLA